MAWHDAASSTGVFIFSAIMTGTMLVGGCSSTPESPPETSKQEIRQDSDRFFQKMSGEEGKPSPSR